MKLREPDLRQVEVEGADFVDSFPTEAEAEGFAADERRRLIREWREDEGADCEYLGPTVTVEPVWIGDPREA